MKLIKSNELKNANGGWDIADHNKVWLNDTECAKLANNGYKVSICPLTAKGEPVTGLFSSPSFVDDICQYYVYDNANNLVTDAKVIGEVLGASYQ